MELRHLRYFVAVAEQGGFTRAATLLHLSQPALSRQIRDLERELCVQLLIRGPVGVLPTPAGEVFYERARHVLAAVDEAARATRRAAEGQRTLRVGVWLPLPGGLHISLLTAFGHAHPEVHLSWREIGFAEYEQPLLDGEVDVALMWLPVDPERLLAVPLASEPRGLAVPRGHALWDAESVPLADALSLPLAPVHQVSTRMCGYWQMWAERGGEPPLAPGEPSATVPELLLAIRLNGVVCPGPLYTYQVQLPEGLRVLPLTGVTDAECGVVRRRDDRRELPRLFCDFVVAILRRPPLPGVMPGRQGA